MLEALDSARYERLVRRFAAVLRTRTGTRTPPALAVGPDLLEARQRALTKAASRIARGSAADDYHRVRIATKRFRYALEFLDEVYPGTTRRLVRRTVALQDLLGGFQDADVAVARLRYLAAGNGEELGPATVFAMGEIAERYRALTGGIRARTRDAVAALEGKTWKEARRQLEEQRPRSSGTGDAPAVPG
jgi:CHAD domain-containing protein